MTETLFLAVTNEEAEMLFDSFSVTKLATHDFMLKVASLVLEYAAEGDLRDATALLAESAGRGVKLPLA